MTETYEPPTPNAAVVVGPHDFLVLAFNDLSDYEVDRLRKRLRKHSPGLADRTLIVGAEQLAVIQVPRTERRRPAS